MNKLFFNTILILILLFAGSNHLSACMNEYELIKGVTKTESSGDEINKVLIDEKSRVAEVEQHENKEKTPKPEKFNNLTVIFVSLSAVTFGLFIFLFIRSQKNKNKRKKEKGRSY